MVKCSSDQLSFKKIYDQENEDRLKTIELTFGTTEGQQQKITGIQKLVIHPDYYQFTGDTVVGHTDVALIRTAEDIFSLNTLKNATIRYPYVVPICLPPKLNYKVDVDETIKGIYEPFEDMDCLLIPG